MTNRASILDSSVFVDYFRAGKHKDKVQGTAGIIRTSAVVLTELWRGATRTEECEFLSRLEKAYPVWHPSRQNWADSGRILNRIRASAGFGQVKLRDLHFDVLIALTARSYGAQVITTNRLDFELIRTYVAFELEIWQEERNS